MSQAEVLEMLPPAPIHGGLSALDLNVTATTLVISWDKDAVSALLDATLEQYDGLIVQESDVPAIKSEMAGLNKLASRLDLARKDIKRQIGAPIAEFEDDVKAMTTRVLNVRSGLDAQVKEFEQRDREGRRAAVQFVVDAVKNAEGVPELDIPIRESWLNKSIRQAEIHADLKQIITGYKLECAAARQKEQAKTERLALVEATAKAQAEQYGFTLPLSKLAPCLTPDISGEEAAGIIGQVYAAEAQARESVKAVPPPVPTSVPADSFPADAFLETAEAFPFAPPVRVANTLTFSIKYDPKYEDTVQEALALLRSVGVVTVF